MKVNFGRRREVVLTLPRAQTVCVAGGATAIGAGLVIWWFKRPRVVRGAERLLGGESPD